MIYTIFRSILFTLLGIQSLLAQTALDQYVQKPDPNYAWEIYATDKDLLVETYYVKLTSQQWRDASEVDRPIWEHQLIITAPKFKFCRSNDSPQTALLLIHGSKNPESGDFGISSDDALEVAAVSLCSVVAVIKQIPNQPLNFSDEWNRPRKEDAILAYSFDKFLQTGDPEWPVHVAMTKAVVRAMDTIIAVSKQEIDDVSIEDFIVFGGSKRGWTTWLTAAVDPRVKAIIPISSDLLNLREQFIHHWEAYGFYSPAINNYLEYDIGCRLQNERGQQLLDIVDPYSYRNRYTMPKLIINSAGDQFFASDSSRFYYDRLPEPKQLRYTPNTDHSQGEDDDLIDLFLNMRSWIDDVNDNKPAPNFSWSFEADGSIRFQVFEAVDRVKLWQAHNPHGRDFRLETIGDSWIGSDLQDLGNGVYRGFVEPPGQGFSAFFIEAELGEGSVFETAQIFTTGIRVTPDILPFAGTACEQPSDYSNLWWNPQLPGQAVQIVQQQDRLGMAWYTYDESGKPTWTTLLSGLTESNTAEMTTSGSLQQFTGPALGTAWDNEQVSGNIVGSATLDFHSSTFATLNYMLHGIPGKISIVPFERLKDTEYSGVWFDPLQAGQGVQLIHKDNRLSGAWYFYDETGKDSWVTFSGIFDGLSLSAELLKFSGPLLGTVWESDLVRSEVAGSVQLDILSPSAIVLHYTLNGYPNTLHLQPFDLPQ